ncbi:MAG: molybdopterin-dependent oxidoreductase [Firmicutes bacterium]|nr:molybdopterin-dependent oxidoreductase [Bacillota bacterium]
MRKRVYFLLFLGLMLSLAVGCGTPVRADLSAYGDEPILIRGLARDDFTVTAHQLAALDCASRSAAGRSPKAGTVHGVGPTLETFLVQYQKGPNDFQKIIFRARDGYTITLGPQSLQRYEIILAVANGKEPLSENEAPLRMLIPEAESSKWVRMVTEIEFVPNE